MMPSFAYGGAERVTMHLARHLDRSLFRPRLIVLNGRGPLSPDVPADVPVVDLARPRIRTAAPQLVQVLRQRRPQLVYSSFVHLNLALLAARHLLGDTRIVIREPSLPSASLPLEPLPRVFTRGCRTLYPQADQVIATSSRTRDELLAVGVPVDRLVVLENPVDDELIRSRAQPPERGPGSGRRLVAAGRLVREKGFDRLVESMAALDSIDRCTILGDGPEGPLLERVAADLTVADRLRLPGRVDEPWRWMAGADAVVLPSRCEGMPNVALEALACGTPVIATPEAGGITEVAELVPQAVTVAAAGSAMTAALHRVQRHSGELRPGLLPQRFRILSALDRYEQVFLATLAA